MMWVVDYSDVYLPKETLNKTLATFFLIELLYSLIFGVVKDNVGHCSVQL